MRRGTVIVAVITGGLAAVVVTQYRGLEGAIALSSLSALADNPAIRTLFGPPVALDDPGGFTVWRTGTVLAVLVGVWAVLTATRLTRGEEEAGRWDLLLAGRITLRSLVVRTLVVVLCAAAVPGVAVAVALAADRDGTRRGAALRSRDGRRRHDRAALGAAAGQLLTERRAASGLATALLLAGLLARMVADGVPALAWLQWGTPFGLIGRIAPFAENRILPLVVLAGLVAAAGVLAVALAAGRDVGSGRVRGGERRHTPSRLLRSLPGLALHRTRRATLTWGLGLSAYFLLIGLLATAMLDFLRANPVFARLAAQAGLARLASVGGYVASLFSLLAVAIGAFAAGRMAHAAGDETAGRLALLFSLPVARARWAAIEAGVVALACRDPGGRGRVGDLGGDDVGRGRARCRGGAGRGRERRPGRPAVPRCGARRAGLGAAGGAGTGRAAGRRRLPAAGPGGHVPMAGLGARAVAVRPPLGGAGRAAGRRRRAGDARRRRPARRLRAGRVHATGPAPADGRREEAGVSGCYAHERRLQRLLLSN